MKEPSPLRAWRRAARALCRAALLCLAGVATAGAGAQAVAPPATAAATSARPPASAPTPPLAPRVPQDVTVHGDARTDDYFWLRHKDQPAVLDHLRAENAYSAAMLAPLQPLKQQLYDEMLARLKQDDEAVPYRIGRWWYFSRTRTGQAYPVHLRRPAVGTDRHDDPAGATQTLFDLNAMAQGKAYLRLGEVQVSPDGQRIAYALDETGGRDFTLRVRQMPAGRDLALRVPQVSSWAWAADSRTLFYVTMDSAKRAHRLWRVDVTRAAPAQLVHEEPNALYDLNLEATRDGRWLVLSAQGKDDAELRVRDARQPLGVWHTVLPRRSGVLADLDHRDGRFYLRINDTGPDFRLISVDARQPDLARAHELIPAQPGLMLEQVALFQHHLVVTERRQGLLGLRIRDLRHGESAPGAEHLVQFDEPVHSVQLRQNLAFDTDSLRYGYQSLATPEQVVDYQMDRRSRRVLKQQPVLGGFDASRYATARLMATAPDGTAVPVSLVWRKDLRRGTPQPLLLGGYGAYGVPSDPYFSSSRVSLLDRGVVVATAHIRGGGDLGRSWYLAGKMANKANSFSDFVACADALVAQGWTTPEQLAIEGGSAGGLLMGAVVNLRPALFHTVLAHVPFVDVVNTMLDESLPLTVQEFQEWGNPKLPEQYRWIRAYSPYDNLKPGAYPAMLLRTGLNDSQVPYWEPTKYVARLRTLKTDDRPLLLTVNMAVGHGGASGRYDALKERAEDLAFLLQQWGLR